MRADRRSRTIRAIRSPAVLAKRFWRRLPKIRKQYEGAPEPKEFLLLEGSAHAQFLFDTDQGDRLMRAILRFLTE